MGEHTTPIDVSKRQKSEASSLLLVQDRTVPDTEQVAVGKGGLVNTISSEATWPSVLVTVTVRVC